MKLSKLKKVSVKSCPFLLRFLLLHKNLMQLFLQFLFFELKKLIELIT
jgi:hypothetical protein